MALSSIRSERRLERRRGAASRQVKDIADFKLVLPSDAVQVADRRKSLRTGRKSQIGALIASVPTQTPTSKPHSSNKPRTKSARKSFAFRRTTRHQPVILSPGANHDLIEGGSASDGTESASLEHKGSLSTAPEGQIGKERVSGVLGGSGNEALKLSNFKATSPQNAIPSQCCGPVSAEQDAPDDSEAIKGREQKAVTQSVKKRKRAGQPPQAPDILQEKSNHQSEKTGDLWPSLLTSPILAIEVGDADQSNWDQSARDEDQSGKGNHRPAPKQQSTVAVKGDVFQNGTADQQNLESLPIEPKKKRRKKRKCIGQQRPKRAPPRATKAKSTSQETQPRESQLAPDPAVEPTRPKSPSSATSIEPQQAPEHATTHMIPITIYRPILPPELEASDPKSTDTTNDHTITPIDVLSQISRELIDRSLNNHPKSSHLSPQSHQITEAYGLELDSFLRLLNQEFAAKEALERQVKALNEEEMSVRKEIEEVRKVERKVRERLKRAKM